MYFSSVIIVNQGNGKCLHVASDSDYPNDYTSVNVRNCDNSNSQKWKISNGHILHAPSGKCLDMDANNG